MAIRRSATLPDHGVLLIALLCTEAPSYSCLQKGVDLQQDSFFLLVQQQATVWPGRSCSCKLYALVKAQLKAQHTGLPQICFALPAVHTNQGIGYHFCGTSCMLSSGHTFCLQMETMLRSTHCSGHTFCLQMETRLRSTHCTNWLVHPLSQVCDPFALWIFSFKFPFLVCWKVPAPGPSAQICGCRSYI